MATNSETGLKVGADMKAGKLIDDKIIFEVIGKYLSKPEIQRVMFDGFPRTAAQAKQLGEMLKQKNQQLAAVIYLDVPDDVMIKRVSGRRVHEKSGRTYHITAKPPKVADKDDETGEPLIQRSDDTEETMKRRLKQFHDNNDAVMKYYEDLKIVHKIDGNADIEKVWKSVDEVLTKAL